MVGYSRVSCTPDTMFTGDSFEVTLPNNAVTGEVFRVCVQLTSGDCTEMASIDFTGINQSINCSVYVIMLYYCSSS